MHKVVIVEDEEMIRKGVIYSIDWISLGFSVVGEASNGKAGVELIKELQPDLVITDLKMPYLSGLDMLKELKESTSLNFASIVLTSYSDFEYARQSISLGVFEYLLKPIDDEILKNVLLRLKDTLIENDNLTKNQKEEVLISFNTSDYQNPYVVQTINFILENYAEKLTLESTAENLEISVTYLNKKLKEETGSTFLELLNRYRITKSVELLKEGSYKVYEISDMTGFTDYRHFCNVFKKYIGVSPTAFIKS